MMRRDEKNKRLREAGFVPLPPGQWVEPAFLEAVQTHLRTVWQRQRAALSEPPKPRGRPKKEN